MSPGNYLKLNLVLIAFLLCLQLQVKAYSPFEAYSLRRNTIMNAYAGSSGIVELKKDSGPAGGFYVEADLTYQPSKSSNDPSAPGTVKMMLSIPNIESMVSSTCLNFQNYDCSKYNCSQTAATRRVEYPYFSTTGQLGRADLYLDYNYWTFTNSPIDLYFAGACQTRDSNVGTDRYGVLGLGTGTRSVYNFKSSKAFSFQIDSDLNKGKLLFKNDPANYAESSSPILVLPANTTWQTQIYDGAFELDYHVVGFTGNLAYDINSDATALPIDLFKTLVRYLEGYLDIHCGPESYRPICNSNKKVQDLLNMTLSINGNRIVIPPKIYATAINETAFYLNYRGTDSSLTGKSYITPSFQNSVILDARFMSYYHLVFDFITGNNYVYIYKAKEVGPQPDPNPGYTFWIVFGVVLVVIIAGLWWWYRVHSRKVPFVPDAPKEISFVPAAPAPAENDIIFNQALLRNYE